MNKMATGGLLPELPLDEWERSKNTIHLFMQIVGKIRLMSFPKLNHWWHVSLYLSPRGVTTRPIPYGDILFEIEFDFIDHALVIKSSDGHVRRMGLKGLAVAQFHNALFHHLSDLGIDVTIRPYPYDIPDISVEHFEKDHKHRSYDKEAITKFWQALVQVNSAFEEFRAGFVGKSSPPHLFWHHLDLAVTRFSGRPAPARENASNVEREAYSHEVVSVGFWAGDKNMREPAFYGYAAPTPEGLFAEPLMPEEAFWNREAGMALMKYNDIRMSENPRQKIKDFADSVYLAGARKSNWNIEDFRPDFA